jgi:MFS family permease
MSSRFSSGGSSHINLAVFAAGFATFVNMWCTQAILPVLAAAFHIAQAQTGLTVTAPLLATAGVAPVVGAISDRFGRKRFIVAAAFLLVIPTLAAAAAPTFGALVLARFAQGLTLPFIFTVTIAYIGDETAGGATARLAGTYTSGAIMGGFSGRLISGVITAGYGWRPAFCAIAALTLCVAVLIALALPGERNFRPVYGFARALKSFPAHLTNPKLIATFGVGFGVLFSLVAVFTFINFRLAAAPYRLYFRGLSGRCGDEPGGGAAFQPVRAPRGDGGGGAGRGPGAGDDAGCTAMVHRGRAAAGVLRHIYSTDVSHGLCRHRGAGCEIDRRGAVRDVLLYRRQRRRLRARRAVAGLWLAGLRGGGGGGAGDHAGGGAALLGARAAGHVKPAGRKAM